MTHFHFWRLTAPGHASADGAIDLDFFFALDKFAVGDACQAMMDDIVMRHPEVKRLESFARLDASPSSPNASFACDTRDGGMSTWHVIECSGRCRSRRRREKRRLGSMLRRAVAVLLSKPPPRNGLGGRCS
ncbi:hypothetical protein GCM10010411_56080 [Actinomadura fulvescens]|uniref:Uncharacterized protein n=1 Tax=Actinomadura fulvescens TaxID=46160 RepID=A0ABN3Q2R1_9ACTN